MVIAKSSWFKRRKYLGWGLYPKTWQGILYTIIIVIISIGIIYLPIDFYYKIIIEAVWAIFLIIDIGHAMINIKDEREKIHEAISERNALWSVIIVLAIGLSYQVGKSAISNNYGSIDCFLIAALLCALIVKALSNYWLDKKN